MGEPSISTDLLRKFVENGHNVYVICSTGKESGHTELSKECGVTVLRVKTGKHKRQILFAKVSQQFLFRTFIYRQLRDTSAELSLT